MLFLSQFLLVLLGIFNIRNDQELLTHGNSWQSFPKPHYISDKQKKKNHKWVEEISCSARGTRSKEKEAFPFLDHYDRKRGPLQIKWASLESTASILVEN